MLFIAYALFYNAYSQDDSFRNSTGTKEISFHHVEVSAGIGIAWLTQASVTIFPKSNFFGQLKYSNSLIAEEYCISAGYQMKNIYYHHSFLRLGIGYSHGKKSDLVFGEGENVGPDTRWNGVSAQFSVVHYFFDFFGLSVTCSALYSQNMKLLSINPAILFAFF